MKTKFLLSFTATVLLLSLNVNAQQWSGSTTTTGNIYRTGNVGIGITSPSSQLELGANQWLKFHATGTQSGILFYETGTHTSSSVQYGAKLYYDQSKDMLRISTMQNNTENVGICIRRTYPRVGIGNFTSDSHIASPLNIRGTANNAQLEIGNSTTYDGNYILSYDRVASAYKNLVIRSTAEPTMTLLTNGNVGIGATTPTSKLHVLNSVGLGSKYLPSSATLNIENNGYNMIFDGNELYTNGEMHIGSTQGVINLFKVNASGPVAGAVRVDVDGKLWAEEIEVRSDVDADYVFADDYELPSLKEVEAYVRSERHLPDIPSAEEFSQRGQNLAEMDNLLLKKVEELTLYVIELEKQISELKGLKEE